LPVLSHDRAGPPGRRVKPNAMTATLADFGIVFGRVFFVMMFILNSAGCSPGSSASSRDHARPYRANRA